MPEVKHSVCYILHARAVQDASLWGLSKKLFFDGITTKLLTKMAGWKSTLLSSVGKEILLKTVSQSIPNYAMSILLLPKGFSKDLMSAVCRFWWSSGNMLSLKVNSSGVLVFVT